MAKATGKVGVTKKSLMAFLGQLSEEDQLSAIDAINRDDRVALAAVLATAQPAAPAVAVEPDPPTD